MYKNKTCKMKECNNVFVPTSGSQKYCDNCKNIAKKERERLQWRDKSRKLGGYKEHHRKCKFCEKEFSTYYKRKITCGSEECENKRKRQNAIEIDKVRSKNRSIKAKIERQKIIAERLRYIKYYVEKINYNLVSAIKYKTSHNSRLGLMCPNGHKWVSTFHNFKDNKNRCAICYNQNNYVSKPEQIIRDFLETSLPDINVMYNDRSLIGPKELDFYFPEHHLAIEVCGLYWHGEVSAGKSRKYHYNKMQDCSKKNVRLITIFEDEIINNKDIVLSRIRQALEIQDRRIFARKCDIKEIDSKTANLFFVNNHIQGRSTAVVRYGLFFNDEMVCVGSLGKTLRKHTARPTTIELKRFCTLSGTHVIGGVGKIFKQMKIFAKENGYTEIRSYCDMRYANIFNTVYELLGFNLSSYTKYTPHYFKGQKRYRNYSLRKTPEERKTGNTEWELRKEQGYDRIWDCGHRTYTYEV